MRMMKTAAARASDARRTRNLALLLSVQLLYPALADAISVGKRVQLTAASNVRTSASGLSASCSPDPQANGSLKLSNPLE
jgi:hypothetical protein